MSRYRSILVFILDILMVIINYIFALLIYFDFSVQRVSEYVSFFGELKYVVAIYAAGFLLFKLNKSMWTKISVEEGMRVVAANLTISFIIIILKLLGVFNSMPKSVILIAFLLITLTQEIVRFSYRTLRYIKVGKVTSITDKKILIYGAGEAGAIVLREYLQGDSLYGNIVGFVDDNLALQGRYVYGKRILGPGARLEEIVLEYNVDEIIVAAPSQPLSIQREIMERCFRTGLPVKSVNSVENLINGEPLKHSLKKVDIVDLLDRKEVILSNKKIEMSIKNKDILVTGAAGSIGSELVRQIIKFNPRTMVVLDINENGIYNLQQELLMKMREGILQSEIELTAYVGSIRDYKAIERIFANHDFDLVFHAAAHKHVPLMETSPYEAVKNNIFGTHNLVELSKKYGVKKFLNISTDKAVNPTNVMGATKRFNEMIIQSQDEACQTKFMAVRFGNVLGSDGSVVPLFQKQIASGGPVTVTHPEIVRYFMTIPEAVSLILEAETFAKGGEIFVLDMGEPVKILDLAVRVITLSGYRPYKDIDIEFTGLRPGEKLFEELLMDEEGLERTPNDLIHVTEPMDIDNRLIEKNLAMLREFIDDVEPTKTLISALEQVVPTFKHEPNGIAVVSKKEDINVRKI